MVPCSLRGTIERHRPDEITIRRLDDGTAMFIIYHEAQMTLRCSRYGLILGLLFILRLWHGLRHLYDSYLYLPLGLFLFAYVPCLVLSPHLCIAAVPVRTTHYLSIHLTVQPLQHIYRCSHSVSFYLDGPPDFQHCIL